MTREELRNIAAAAALGGMLGNPADPGASPEHYALSAVQYADALVAALESTPARADIVKAGAELIAALESEISRLRKGDPSRPCDRCASSEESAASPPGCYLPGGLAA